MFKEERFKFNISDFSLELDETINLIVILNGILESQNLKPVKLYTDGKNGDLYSYISKEELQNYIEAIKKGLFKAKEIEFPKLPLLPHQLPEPQQSKDVIISKEALEKISLIKPADAKVITNVEQPTKLKLTIPIGCTNCGYVSFQTEEQYAETEKQAQFTCPDCKQVQKIIIEGKRDRRNIIFRLLQIMFAITGIWGLYWGYYWEIIIWSKPITALFSIFTFTFFISFALITVIEYVRRKIKEK